MQLNRLDGESKLQHHKRLVDGKLVDKTLADIDYSELAEYVYGQPYSSDVARRMMYGSKKTLELIEEEGRKEVAGTKMATELDLKMAELQKERQKFFDQRMAYSKLLRDRAREEELNEIIERCVASGNLPELRFEDSVCHHFVSDTTLLVSLNDIHYGAAYENAWGRYNSAICAEMMERYAERAIEIGSSHLCEDCVVWCAGDLISGNIHHSIQVSNKENVIEQVMGVSELIAQFLAVLSRQFRTVRFVSVAGNHSRIEPNKDKAITQERLDDLVEWYLAARLQNFENILIDDEHKLDSTMSLFDVRGKNYLMVHGDFDGSLGKVQALRAMVKEPLYAILSGHMHHNQTDVVQGVRTVMAGSFQGMDQFCVEKRIFGQPEQMICVCDENGIRCHYDIALNS